MRLRLFPGAHLPIAAPPDRTIAPPNRAAHAAHEKAPRGAASRGFLISVSTLIVGSAKLIKETLDWQTMSITNLYKRKHCLHLANISLEEVSDFGAPIVELYSTDSPYFDLYQCPHCGRSHLTPSMLAIRGNRTRMARCPDGLKTVTLGRVRRS
ncbi:MAG: hypothetical protein K2Z25_15395 [Beijerinckiaceae bacterium]|nr:hypothetical protein [Beijerinckiaceae bacterium]